MISNKIFSSSNGLPLIVGILLVAAPLAAQELDPPELEIQEREGRAGIRWQPRFDFDSATLSVVGPHGEVFREHYGGEIARYELVDDLGDRLPDARYNYQLTVRRTLSPSEQSALAQARQDSERRHARSEGKGEGAALGASGEATYAREGSAGNRPGAGETVSGARPPTRLERTRRRLEQENGPFVVTRSGHFVIEGGSIVLGESRTSRLGSSRAARKPTPTDTGDGKEGMKAISAASDFQTGDQGATSGLCAGCDDTADPQDGTIVAYDDAVPAVTLFETAEDIDWTFLVDNRDLALQWSDNVSFEVTLPFQVEPSADTNSLYVADKAGGAIGIGTGAPAEDIHNLDVAPAIRLEDADDSTYGGIRYNAGVLKLEGNSEQNIVQIDGAAPGGAIVVAEDGGISLGVTRFASSRQIKKDFEPIDRRAILEHVARLPVTEWSFKSDTDEARHLGPVAEDFHALFGLGEDDKHISPNDLAGVSLGAVQGLLEVLEERETRLLEQRKELARQDSEIAELRDRVKELEEISNRLLDALGDGDGQALRPPEGKSSR